MEKIHRYFIWGLLLVFPVGFHEYLAFSYPKLDPRKVYLISFYVNAIYYVFCFLIYALYLKYRNRKNGK